MRIMLALLATAGMALAACGDGGTVVHDKPSETVDEVSAHGDEVCPATLPGDPTENYGFGIGEPASDRLALATPEAAWVCGYATRDTGETANGASYAWERMGPAMPVPESALAGLTAALKELAPAPIDRACTAELGPRWMLVYSHGRDLTGVVIDDFGCSEVRLTDEPFTTPPGESTQPGTVRGVLLGPAGLREQFRELGGG